MCLVRFLTLLQWIIYNYYLVSLCCYVSNTVTFSAINILSNKSLDIRNYASLIHLKDVYSLQAIMSNILT